MKRRTLLQSICAAIIAPFGKPVAADAVLETSSPLWISADLREWKKTWIVTAKERYLFWDSTGIPNIGDPYDKNHVFGKELICDSLDWQAVTMDSEGDHTYQCVATFKKQ